jgi:hypothetical protein
VRWPFTDRDSCDENLSVPPVYLPVFLPVFLPVHAQPRGLNTRVVDAGLDINFAAGRRGRTTNSPPQLGHACSLLAHIAQNVHSNVQMRASALSPGKSTSQH